MSHLLSIGFSDFPLFLMVQGLLPIIKSVIKLRKWTRREEEGEVVAAVK